MKFVVDVFVPTPEGRKRFRQAFERRPQADAQATAIRSRLDRGLPPFETEDEAAKKATVSVLDVLHYYPKTPRGDQHIEMFKTCAIASQSVEEIGVRDLDGFVAERGGKKTTAKDLSFLRRACNLAKAHGLINLHVFESLVGDKATMRRLMPAWSPADSPGREIPDGDFEAIFHKLNKRARRAILFARTTGCRLNEVASLDWKMLEPGKGFRPIQQKKSGPRVVAFEKEIVGERGIGLVFSELGSTVSEIRQRLQDCWIYAVKAAKTPHYRFHDLRHTFGTVLLEKNGGNFSAVAAVMGITEAMAHVYAHEDRERKQVAAHGLVASETVAKLARLA
jgi:integrase